MRFVARILACSLLVLSGAAPAAAAAPEPMSVASFIASPPVSGTHEIIGYVVGGFICPPCPPDALCEPCPADSIYVADKLPAKPMTYETLNRSTLVIETADPKRLPFGSRFRLTIEVTQHSSSDRGINDLKLIKAATEK